MFLNNTYNEFIKIAAKPRSYISIAAITYMVATGISAGRLVNLKQSLLDAGGNAEDFQKIALKLTQTLGDAADGNEKTRKSFKDLGITSDFDISKDE